MVGYDYSNPGHYFVTICVKDFVPVFGEIIDGKMVLNDFGKIVNRQWLWLGKQYPYIKLDEYMLMPEHFHGILRITNSGRERSRPFPTDCIKIKTIVAIDWGIQN